MNSLTEFIQFCLILLLAQIRLPEESAASKPKSACGWSFLRPTPQLHTPVGCAGLRPRKKSLCRHRACLWRLRPSQCHQVLRRGENPAQKDRQKPAAEAHRDGCRSVDGTNLLA